MDEQNFSLSLMENLALKDKVGQAPEETEELQSVAQFKLPYLITSKRREK